MTREPRDEKCGPAAAFPKTIEANTGTQHSPNPGYVKAHDGIPVVRAYAASQLPGGMTHAAIWCRWCGTWHFHGIGDDELAFPGGHRISHCLRPTSPLVGGIYVWLIGPLPPWCRRPDGRLKSRLGPARARRLEQGGVP